VSNVRKFDTTRWESVADLARWLLTHADEYTEAVLILRDRDKHPDDLEAACGSWTVPRMPIGRVLGMLELAKIIYAERACGRPLDEITIPNAP